MKVSRYQWMGLLAGFPLFSGAWLAAYYNNEWFGVLGAVVMFLGLWVAVKVERRSLATVHMQRGLVAGILAGVEARILGILATLLYDKWGLDQAYTNYSSTNDMFRAVLNGGVIATIILVAVCGLFGVMASWFEPCVETQSPSIRRKK